VPGNLPAAVGWWVKRCKQAKLAAVHCQQQRSSCPQAEPAAVRWGTGGYKQAAAAHWQDQQLWGGGWGATNRQQLSTGRDNSCKLAQQLSTGRASSCRVVGGDLQTGTADSCKQPEAAAVHRHNCLPTCWHAGGLLAATTITIQACQSLLQAAPAAVGWWVGSYKQAAADHKHACAAQHQQL